MDLDLNFDRSVSGIGGKAEDAYMAAEKVLRGRKQLVADGSK